MSTAASRGDDVRRRNLALVLRSIHSEGPRSRAALTEATGLNRSTIANLVAELVERRFVLERAPAVHRGVGRPSPTVAADPRVVAIAAHPEVDALTIAAVALDRSVSRRERIEYDDLLTPEKTAELIGSRTREWGGGPDGLRIIGVGVAVPGLVRAPDGLVRLAPHLEWTDAPLRDLIGDATGLPVVVGNDATWGALAEHRFGAAVGIDDVIYLNGGASGIGGGVIVGGTPLRGAGGYAGEFGQTRIAVRASDRSATRGRTLEDEVSRRWALEATGLVTADDENLERSLAAGGDRRIAAGLARQRDTLATALANAVNAFNPSIVVLGGYLATIARLGMTELQRAVSEQAMPSCAEHLQIVTAALGPDRLLIGAAEAVFEEELFSADRRGAR